MPGLSACTGGAIVGLFSRPLTIVICFWNGASGLRIAGMLEAGPFSGRRPLLHDGAVRQVEKPHARLRRGGGLRQRRQRRNHRVEQRQADGDAGAAKERSTREVFLRDEHRQSQ